ncbi:MAG: PilN domain-containing protein [Verrucomicrobiota bacterium]
MKSDSIIAIPSAERGWEIWKWARRGARLLKTVDMLDELPAGGKDAIIGLGPGDCVSIGVSLPTADQSLFNDMAFAQLDMKGHGVDGPDDTIFAYHILERSPSHAELSVDVLMHDFNEDLCVQKAQAYTAATRMFPIHDQTVVVLQLHGRLVLAAGKHGRMVFTQILNCGVEFNEAFVQEVNLTILSLQGAGQLPERVTLEIWAPVLPESRELLDSRFQMAVDYTRRPDPDPRLAKDASTPMLPGLVQAAIAKARRRQTIRLCVLTAIGVYSVIAVLLTLKAQDLKDGAEAAEARIVDDRDEVAFIQEASSRVTMLEPAYEKRLYPMVQLDEITRIMPGQGIVIQKFETRDRRIRIEGVASSVELVVGFVEDLGKDTDLPGYSWEMPQQPSVQDNNTARFTIVGNYATGN